MKFRKCPFSDLKDGKAQDRVTEYSPPILYSSCIVENRLRNGELWGVYLDYSEEKSYYKLPFLVAFLLQVMNTDRAVLWEAEMKRAKGKKK